MVSQIIALPAFTESQSIISTIFRSMLFHRKLNEIVKHEMIPKPTYRQFNVEMIEAFFEKGLAYPEDAVLRVISETGPSIQATALNKSFHKYENLITYLKKEDKKGSFFLSNELEDSVNQLRRKVTRLQNSPNVLPVLNIDFEAEISLNSSHIQSMGNGEWLEDLLLFLKILSEASIAIDDKLVSFDSFLFYQNGRIAKFIHYDCLSFFEKEEVVWKNINVLRKLMIDFYDYFSEYVDENSEFNQHNSRFSRLYQQVIQNQNMVFHSFDEVLNLFYNQKMPLSTGERIGVFVDFANIYTEMGNLNIDYNKLFSKIYGKQNMKYIKDKYVFFFESTGKAGEKSEIDPKKRYIQQNDFKEKGFEIDNSNNGQAKAKQVVNGVLIDADDTKLIQRMEERFSHLTSVLLLSGDKDYLEILKKYQDHGKTVKVVSTHPESTAGIIMDMFDHSFITDYWDCIFLKEERQ